MPAVPGGIRDAAGTVIAPDPATLPPDELDLAVLWRHPGLILAQACWGPLEESDVARHVFVLGQPSYDGVAGGRGEHYSSAIVMRRDARTREVFPPAGGHATIPLDRIRAMRFAFNTPDSMSGMLALARDLARAAIIVSPHLLGSFFSALVETGSHRASVRAVAQGSADVAAIDCRTWVMAREHEPAAHELAAVGWTAQRKGLPFISGRAQGPRVAAALSGFALTS
jgi:ABC-type phosphate/phosphonate transport system substrate-binding protein